MGELELNQIKLGGGGVGSLVVLVDVDPPNEVPGLPAIDASLLLGLVAAVRPKRWTARDEGLSATNNLTWIPKVVMTVVLPAGDFDFSWQCELQGGIGGAPSRARARWRLNGGAWTDIALTEVSEKTGWVAQSGFDLVPGLAAGTYEFAIDHSSSKTKTTSVRRARVLVGLVAQQ